MSLHTDETPINFPTQMRAQAKFCQLFAGLSFCIRLFQNLSALLTVHMLVCLCFFPIFHLRSLGIHIYASIILKINK